MATVGDRFHEALALHQSGRGDEAEPLYRELLRNDPAHAGARHLLGLVLHERGDLPGALAHIQKDSCILQPSTIASTKGSYLDMIGKQLAPARISKNLQVKNTPLQNVDNQAWQRETHFSIDELSGR